MAHREFHPAADIFPMLADDELQALAEDIKAHGLQVPIDLLDGKILDGRNRYRACEIAGVTPRMVNVHPADPIAYVLSKNLHRRHLTTSQRAMIAARVREYYEQEAKERQKAAQSKPGQKAAQGGGNIATALNSSENAEKGKSRDQAGRALNVSGKTVDAATKVLEKGSPELVQAVDKGKTSVSAAAKQIEIAKEEPPEPMKDADGVPIPEYLRPIFATQPEFEAFAYKISRLKGEFESGVQANPEAWSAIEPQKRVADLSALRQEFSEARPYLVCPLCGGDDPDRRCKQCHGRGWLSRYRARSVAIDLRNPQRKAHGLDPLTGSSQRAGERTK